MASSRGADAEADGRSRRRCRRFHSIAQSNVTTDLYVAAWNGKRLTAMKSAVAVGSSSSFEQSMGVSCATLSNCAVTGTVVGGVNNDSTLTFAPVTEIWDGKTWRRVTMRWPMGSADSTLVGVSCYAAHSCEAVGADSANLGTSFDAAGVSFHGTTATLQAVRAPSKGDSDVFDDVSCLPWATCVAVGETGKTTTQTPATMTGVWNGKAWKLYPGF